MKGLRDVSLILPFIFCCILVYAHHKKFTPANAHSHNDYLNSTPFYLAFKNGFGSIEADIFPANGILLVAHRKNEIDPQRSLKNLYLDPLQRSFDSGRARKLSLLIDIKEDYKLSLALLSKELDQLTNYLPTTGKQNFLTIIISGSRPSPAEYKNYPAYIFF